MRVKEIEKDGIFRNQFPVDRKFMPTEYFYISCDNYDANIVSSFNAGIHTLGSMINCPDARVQTPMSMLQDNNYQPTAPQQIMHHSDRQIKLPAQEQRDYFPSLQRNNLSFDLQTTDFVYNDHCSLTIKQINEKAFSLVCLKQLTDDLNSKTKPSMKIMIRDLLEKPEITAKVFHLRFIEDNPATKRCVRRFLDELKTNICDRYNILSIVISADGKIFDLLVDILSENDEYNWVLPYLGEMHLIQAYMRCIMKKYGGFCLRGICQQAGYRGAKLIKVELQIILYIFW